LASIFEDSNVVPKPRIAIKVNDQRKLRISAINPMKSLSYDWNRAISGAEI
jgi:hypothetical protein